MNEHSVLPFRRAPESRNGAYLLVRDCSENFEVLHAFGDLDLASAQELEAMTVALSAQPHEPALAIDLTACHYLDSTILTVFVRATKALGKRFALVIPPENPVQRIFHIVGLDAVLPIYPSLASAAESLGATQPSF